MVIGRFYLSIKVDTLITYIIIIESHKTLFRPCSLNALNQLFFNSLQFFIVPSNRVLQVNYCLFLFFDLFLSIFKTFFWNFIQVIQRPFHARDWYCWIFGLFLLIIDIHLNPLWKLSFFKESLKRMIKFNVFCLLFKLAFKWKVLDFFLSNVLCLYLQGIDRGASQLRLLLKIGGFCDEIGSIRGIRAKGRPEWLVLAGKWTHY